MFIITQGLGSSAPVRLITQGYLRIVFSTAGQVYTVRDRAATFVVRDRPATFYSKG